VLSGWMLFLLGLSLALLAVAAVPARALFAVRATRPIVEHRFDLAAVGGAGLLGLLVAVAMSRLPL
jgi:hypothetical protein